MRLHLRGPHALVERPIPIAFANYVFVCDGDQSVELVRDFPRAAKQAQIELCLDERSVIMSKT